MNACINDYRIVNITTAVVINMTALIDAPDKPADTVDKQPLNGYSKNKP